MLNLLLIYNYGSDHSAHQNQNARFRFRVGLRLICLRLEVFIIFFVRAYQTVIQLPEDQLQLSSTYIFRSKLFR